MALEERITLLGDRVLIKLDKAVDHTLTESGILLPRTELAETDGGKLTTRLSNKNHLPQGTIILMSKKAQELLSEVSINDKVYVADHALNTSNYFYPDRTKLVQEFEGYICIPHILIEAKLNNGSN